MFITELKSLPTEDICLQFGLANHSFKYLCDCGFASQLTVADCRDTNAIFVSHTHIDHFINFNGIVRHQLAIGRRVIVTGTVGVAKNVQAQLLSFNWNLLKYDDQAVSYEIREIDEAGKINRFLIETPKWELQELGEWPSAYIYENELFKVRCALLDHGIKTVAYLFETQEKVSMQMENCPYKGGRWINELKTAFLAQDWGKEIVIDANTTRKVSELTPFIQREPTYKMAYVMDFAATEANREKIVELCADVDELFMECYYSSEDMEMAVKNKHSYASFSAQTAKLARAKRVIPVHFSRRYHEEAQKQLILTEFFAHFGENQP